MLHKIHYNSEDQQIELVLFNPTIFFLVSSCQVIFQLSSITKSLVDLLEHLWGRYLNSIDACITVIINFL